MVTRRSVSWLAALVLTSLQAEPPARACSIAENSQHQIDPTLRSTDDTPPAWLSAPSFSLFGDTPDKGGGCATGHSGSSCDGIGTLAITVDATDDSTPSEAIGYRVSLIAGQPLPGLTIPDAPVDSLGNPKLIVMIWSSDARNADAAYDFVLGLTPIDAAGNEGPMQQLPVHVDGHSSGCGIATTARRPDSSVPGTLALLFAASALARSRRRATSVLPRGRRAE